MKATTEVLLVDSDPLRTVSLCDHHTVVTLKQGNALHTNDETPSSEDCEMCAFTTHETSRVTRMRAAMYAAVRRS